MSHVGFQYAEALFSLALEEKKISEVQDAYVAFVDGMDQQIRRFLLHPKVTKQEKKDILDEAVKQPLLRHFLFVLIDNVRFDHVEDALDEFNKIIDNQNNLMHVVVSSKQALSATELAALQQSISKKHGRTVDIENLVDPTIIGGLKIEYEGHILDQTINHQLQSMKHNLTK